MSDNETNQTTIGSIALEQRNKNFFKRNANNTSMSPPETDVNKKHRLEKVGPILILANESFKFDRRDYISFDHSIIETTEADIKFTKLDRHENLLIFPSSFEDADIIMNCKQLYPELKKINLNDKDNRPKIIIKGLSYSAASTHMEKLEEEGVEELINLTKVGNKPVNIVKVVMKDEITASNLLEKGWFTILHLDFKVEKDIPKFKANQRQNNPLDFPTRVEFNTNNQRNQHQTPKVANLDDIHSLFNNLNFRLDRDFAMQTLKLKQETSVEIAQSIEISESNIMKVIQKNNANLATAISQIINIVAIQGSIDPEVSLNIMNQCCPINTNFGESNNEDVDINS